MKRSCGSWPANVSILRRWWGWREGNSCLHPEADKILGWFAENHPNFDLFSNCLQPERLIGAVREYRPHRLYISLDGDRDTYLHMRGKDGYEQVLQVIRELKGVVPVFVMFTLSPYNDFDDLRHVARVCKENGVFLRVGIYNNIPFFDTIEDGPGSVFGQYKNDEVLTYSKVKALKETGRAAGRARVGTDQAGVAPERVMEDYTALIPEEVREYAENFDYIRLYQKWVDGEIAAGLSFHYGQCDRAAGWGCSALSASAHAAGKRISGGS